MAAQPAVSAENPQIAAKKNTSQRRQPGTDAGHGEGYMKV